MAAIIHQHNMHPNPQPVSVVILTHNEEHKIRPALESAAWADEIVVVDDHSTDATLDIVHQYPTRVLTHSYESYAAQVNWGIAQATHEWVFVLDADERLTPELRNEIQSLLKEPPRYDGYILYRSSLFLGHPIRYCGWQDDTVTRLFRKACGKHHAMTDHSDITVQGRVGKLKHKLLHDTYADFDEYFMKMKRYSDRAALDMKHANQPVTWIHLTLRAPFRFCKMYILRFGFMDGKMGLILCGLTAFYVFTKYAKAWHVQKKSR